MKSLFCLLQWGSFEPSGVSECVPVWRDGASSGGTVHPGSDAGRDGRCWFDQGKENCGSKEKQN